MEKYIQKAAVLLEALPYIQNFRDSIIVVKFGGSIMENQEEISGALRDVVFMECVGMKPVIVHGGGKAITAELEKLKVPTHFINGQRYTCEKTIKVVDNVLHNVINSNIVQTINSLGGHAATLSGKHILTAEKAKEYHPENKKEIDLGYVGSVYKVNTDELHDVLAENIIPVITPLATGDDGTVYNVNADIAATKIAEALKARKLVFVSDVPGILKDPNDNNSRISAIYLKDVDNYINAGIISGGMLPKIKSAVEALNAGTNKVHMIDGRIQHSILLEIFTNSGIGTQILKENSKLNVIP